MSEIKNLDATNFEEMIRDSDVPVLVDFWADWCAPCKAMEPMLEELSSLMNGKIRFAKLDVDSNRELAIQYRIQSVPTLLVFQDGRPVDQITGTPPRYNLLSRLERHL